MGWIRFVVEITLLSVYLFESINGLETPMDYMRARTCVHQMPDFQFCLQKYYSKIQGIHNDYRNAKSNESKSVCCAFWDLFECLKMPAQSSCKVEYRDLGMHLTAINPTLQAPQLCHDYPKGSWKCRFPVWLILIVVIIAAVILTATVLLFICIRNYR